MARENSLEVAAHTILTKGGYGRYGNTTIYNCPAGSDCFNGDCNHVELINGSCAPLDPGGGFTPADDAGSLTRTYTWRDSNVSWQQPDGNYGGWNSDSGEAYVTIRDDWTSTVDDENNLVVTTKTYVLEHGRRDIRTRSGKPGRDVKIMGYNQGSKGWVEYGDLTFWGEDVAAQRVYYSGERYIGTNQFILPPQATSAGINYSVMVWNHTVGYGDYEPYVDELLMGLQFKNGLPNELSPPVRQNVRQSPDICEYEVNATFTFSAPNMGAVLVFDWKYNDQKDYPESNRLRFDASKGSPTTFTLYSLYPTGYQKSAIDWRARYEPRAGSKLQPSDWAYGSEDIVFILPPDATVPDVTTPECAEIGRGALLPEYDYITYYDERNKI